MQNNDGKNRNNNNNNYSIWKNNPRKQEQQQPDETRDPNRGVAANHANTQNSTCNTTAYLKYFKVVEPVELSMFSDRDRYDESKTPLSTYKPLSSNPVSGTVGAKNSKNFGRLNWNDNKSRQYHGYRQNQFNNKKYPNKYRNNKNNASVRFNEIISVKNVQNTPLGNDQPGYTNNSGYTEPAFSPNILTHNNFVGINENSEYDSECESDPGDIEKMNMMTAADFNDDRYARYGIHESEIKDYVRTITFKNCIEYCSKGYIKVNIFISCYLNLLICF